ncbi:class I SAM-dependent methyltransferase [Carboxydothermus pertinax]|uniref:Tellurite resistance methyltransferase TehB-like domain-containing protein n=1 Tax=Carboxydothermus pertinax TaxID=870242 RepID=A0A1L8CSE6_9THEO|nr:methyltransferase domain-containing protein [Carboxydothermus pertinax]GAV21850.1 hypothetical protein cpu_03600 [Carboxydothermus pertinax]
MDKDKLQEIYLKEEYYWRTEPNELSRKVLKYIPEDQRKERKLVDIGAGEGRDSVFFAKEGFEVLAVDISPAGLMKAEKLASKEKVAIKTLDADINDLIMPKEVDIIYSIGTLQYLHPQNRNRQFQHLKEKTRDGGLHILFAFIEHPEVEIAPDWGKNEYLYGREELQSYDKEWDILDTYEYIFDCSSSSIPHRHAARVIIAKYGSVTPISLIKKFFFVISLSIFSKT